MTIGFIGCGNMGGALCRAVAKAVGGEKIYASDFVKEKAASLCGEIGARMSTNEEIAKTCRYIFLGVKPQVIEKTIKEISPFLKERGDDFTVISMAAGISRRAVSDMLGFNADVIRIMPNTPCSVGEGVILYTTDEKITAAAKSEFEQLFSYAGITDNIPETLIDAASALSGCGPAFVYMFTEALSDGAVACGLPRDKAIIYASQTVKGAAEMLLKTGSHPAQLKDAVCSPGGTTIEGVHALEKGGLRAASINSVVKAYEKTLKLKK